jgi:Ion channel
MLERLQETARHAKQNRCLFLMLGLLAVLAVGPWLEGVRARVVLYLLEISVFASAVRAIGGGWRYSIPLFVLGLATLALGLLAMATGSPSWMEFAFGLYIAFAIVTLVRVLGYVMQPGTVTADKIYGALSVYLLAGFAWGGAYALTELLRPDSFQWTPASQRSSLTLLQSFVYLSFVTLATLGYGDIVPVTPQARSLALLEAIFGTFYVVVIIARLVAGLERPSRTDLDR